MTKRQMMLSVLGAIATIAYAALVVIAIHNGIIDIMLSYVTK